MFELKVKFIICLTKILHKIMSIIYSPLTTPISFTSWAKLIQGKFIKSTTVVLEFYTDKLRCNSRKPGRYLKQRGKDIGQEVAAGVKNVSRCMNWRESYCSCAKKPL